MFDFKIPFQANELLYGYGKNVRPISEIMFRKFLQFNTKTALPP